MRIILKRGRRLHTDRGRTQLGSGTQIIEIDCQFPGATKERQGCGHIEVDKGRKKINVARIPLRKYRYECDMIDYNELHNTEIVGKEEKTTGPRSKGCIPCG